MLNCVDSNIVQESGVVSLASGRQVLAEEPEYSDIRQSNGNQASLKSSLSGVMEATYGSLRSGQPKKRESENDTVSSANVI